MTAQPSNLQSPPSALTAAMTSEWLTIAPGTPVAAAMAQMNQVNASCILVVEAGKPIGIFTERDAVKLIAARTVQSKATIASVMTCPVITAPLSAVRDLSSALSLMRQHQIRHLPVIDDCSQADKTLVGLVTQASVLQAIQVAALLDAKDELEIRVALGTLELRQANEQLRQEIADRQQVERSLREADRRWRSLLENVRLAVVGLDSAGSIDFVNPFFLQLTGYSEAEVLGQDWLETLIPSPQRRQVQHTLQELRDCERHTHHQHSILTKSGEERLIAWNNTLLKDNQGKTIRILSIGEDVTERQAIERIKDEFVSVVSHELRTPLTSIHGAMSLLASGRMNIQSEQGQRFVKIAVENSRRLVKLVNDILDLERLASGKISLEKQLCNTADLIQRSVEMVQVMANRAEIAIAASSEAYSVVVDPDRLIQVLTNLLSNAIKFSPAGATVWLTVEHLPASGALQFCVKDCGRGIPADSLERIFERFHQVDASDSRQKGGTGLGLAICQSIVEQHRGEIWAESVVGKGTSFYFTLPVTASVPEDSN